jgi:hypothetical protein
MKISYLISAFILATSVTAGEPILYICKHRVAGTTMFQDFPCEKEKTIQVSIRPLPKGNVVASASTSTGQNVPMGYWQDRIGTVSYLQNPVETVSLPQLTEPRSLTGTDFIQN